MVRFSFALNARMQAFIDVRDALACLDTARRCDGAYAWVQAACDLRASLLGDLGRKAALPEIVAILAEMQDQLARLANDHPELCASIRQASNRLGQHMQCLQGGLAEAQRHLAEDALLAAYANAQKKQDLLGHQRCLPQSLDVLWRQQRRRIEQVHDALLPLRQAVQDMDAMLNDYVQWRARTAQEGSDKITPDRQRRYGLLVVGLSPEQVSTGLIPDMSGNHLAIRVRFQRWPALEPAREVGEDVDYHYMLVPVAG
ncbi:MAG: hypothetical protein D6678_03500 [Zetaproteobacteria bacterium]|nr:MAG: hypothetical protein D6678_03500 [Zetaproteobacteria bacterium]